MIWILAAMAGAVAGPPPPTESETTNFLSSCETAAYDNPLSPQVPAWAAVRKNNRLEDFRAFAARFPNSACARAAQQWIALRERAEADFAAAPDGSSKPAMVDGDPAMGISDADYPAEALRKGEQGLVRVSYDIAADGMAESCRVIQSSGSASLDEATCEMVTHRARYRPARDADGKPIRSHGIRSMRWQIPADEVEHERPTLIPGWRMSVAPMGKR
jgi:TonB family protein